MNTQQISWERWANCLPQSQVERIARKTGFRVGDTFNPDRSEVFNAEVNAARIKKLGLQS